MGCGSASAKEPAAGAQPAPAGQPPSRGGPTTQQAAAPAAATAPAGAGLAEETEDGKKKVYNKETGQFEEAKDNLEKKERPDVKKTLIYG